MTTVMQSISPEGEALAFIRQYSVDNETFTADQVCDAYKASGGPEPAGGKGWRDKWGVLMKTAERSEWIKNAGKTTPTSRSTHATTTILWMSRLFKGERTLQDSGLEYCKSLRMRWVAREESDLLKLLMKAHDHGYEAGLVEERKRKETKEVKRGLSLQAPKQPRSKVSGKEADPK